MRLLVVGVLAMVALGGCATPRERPAAGETVDWPDRRDFLRQLDDWRLEGRLAVKTGDDGYSGTLTWEQTKDDVDFRVRGPFGVGGFRIQGDRHVLRLETARGDVYVYSDPEAQMDREFGWSVPVHSMRFWILGVSDPASVAEETIDGQGRLIRLIQNGWAIRYDGYEASDGMLLPRKIVMESDGVRIRLVADRWRLASPDRDIT